MTEELLEVIREAMTEDDVEITEESEFVDDLGLSSMEFFNLISLIEERFHIKFSDREIQNLETIGDMLEIIEEQ